MSDVAVVEPVQGVLMQGELSSKEVVKRRKAIQGALDMSKRYLLELKEQDNWKKDPLVKEQGIKTMEEYSYVAFGYTKQHMYRLISEQEVLESIEDESMRPDNEGQARVLATIPAQYREATMRKAYEIAPAPNNPKLPKKVSAKVLEQAKAVILAQYADPADTPTSTVAKNGNTPAPTPSKGPDEVVPESGDPRDFVMSDAEYKLTPKIVDIVKVKSRKDLYAVIFKYADGSRGPEYYRSSVTGIVGAKVDTSVPNTMSKGEQFAKDAEMSLTSSDFPEGSSPEIFDEDPSDGAVPDPEEVDPLAEAGDADTGHPSA
jgi:hypothetical protein